MFDVKAVEKAAQKELSKERAEKAKGKIKAKLAAISAAEAVTVNLRREYEVLLTEIGSDPL